MKNLIHQLGFGESFAIRTVVAVEELLEHDMIYVYHHIQEGSVVQLIFDREDLQGNPLYLVLFKGFTIGKVKLTGIARSIFENHLDITARIAGVSKEKYMPLQHVDIELGAEALKKVS